MSYILLGAMIMGLAYIIGRCIKVKVHKPYSQYIRWVEPGKIHISTYPAKKTGIIINEYEK